METIPARDAKRRFGQLIDTSQREPVTIEKHGRPVAVVISKHTYDRMQRELEEYRRLSDSGSPPSVNEPATARKLNAIRAAAAHAFPTADIDEMLAEIERGALGKKE